MKLQSCPADLMLTAKDRYCIYSAQVNDEILQKLLSGKNKQTIVLLQGTQSFQPSLFVMYAFILALHTQLVYTPKITI